MPEITYARSDDMSKPEIRRWAAMDTETTYRFSLLALAKIEACRQWVADNPEYPDGTIAYVVTNGGTRLTARMGNGCWIALNPHTAYDDSNLSDVMRVDRILHTPPSIRDHLHATPRGESGCCEPGQRTESPASCRPPGGRAVLLGDPTTTAVPHPSTTRLRLSS